MSSAVIDSFVPLFGRARGGAAADGFVELAALAGEGLSDRLAWHLADLFASHPGLERRAATATLTPSGSRRPEPAEDVAAVWAVAELWCEDARGRFASAAHRLWRAAGYPTVPVSDGWSGSLPLVRSDADGFKRSQLRLFLHEVAGALAVDAQRVRRVAQAAYGDALVELCAQAAAEYPVTTVDRVVGAQDRSRVVRRAGLRSVRDWRGLVSGLPASSPDEACWQAAFAPVSEAVRGLPDLALTPGAALGLVAGDALSRTVGNAVAEQVRR